MALSPDQQEKLLKHLNSNWKQRSCNLCGKTSWTIMDRIFEMREYQGGSLVIGGGGSLMAVIPITCTNCGNTHLLNPLVFGLLENGEEHKDGGHE